MPGEHQIVDVHSFKRKMPNLLHHFITTLFLLSYFPLKVRRYQTVEHIVLFKVKADVDQPKIDAMVAELNDLENMEGVEILHLSSGPVYRVQSSTLNFTHFLHSRYDEPEDLEIFMANPQHLKLVHDYTDPLTDDYMIVNWIVHTEEPLADPVPGSAMRIMFLKLKEEVGDSAIGEVLDLVRKGAWEQKAVQFTCGENYDEAAKGYHVGLLMVFNGVEDLDESGSIQEFAKQAQAMLEDFVESVFVVDYIV